MNQSRSLDIITQQFMSNAEMKDLPSHQRKFILNQFKKLYAGTYFLKTEQMSKVIVEINRKNQVKNNKTEIEEKQQNEIKSTQQNLLKKMQEHNEKRQKAFSKKLSHFKTLEENWKQKMQQIMRKKKQQNRQSIQKATQYRKEVETFWIQNKKRNKSTIAQSKIQTLQSQKHLSIKAEIENSDKIVSSHLNQFYQNKQKSQSKNEFPSVSRTLLPIIEKKNFYLGKIQKKNSQKIITHKSFHKFIDDKTIQQHIEKSKLLQNEKEQLTLHKALQKMKMIQERRQKCREERQKSIKQTKEKRSLREGAIAHNSKRKKIQEQQIQARTAKGKRNQSKSDLSYDKNRHSRSESANQNISSLNESIVRHKQAKEQLEEQEFTERGEILKTNIMKQKKGKMLRLVKQTINKMRKQALNES